MAGPAAEGAVPEIGVGMLGYAFMGKAHSNAYKTIPYMMYPPPAIPKMVSVSGRNEKAVAEAARRNSRNGDDQLGHRDPGPKRAAALALDEPIPI